MNFAGFVATTGPAVASHGVNETCVHAEELLAAIAAATGERVCVPPERWALLLMLGLPAERLFTTDTRAARIHAVLRHTVRNAHVHTSV